jgi:hypothetical protein
MKLFAGRINSRLGPDSRSKLRLRVRMRRVNQAVDRKRVGNGLGNRHEAVVREPNISTSIRFNCQSAAARRIWYSQS